MSPIDYEPIRLADENQEALVAKHKAKFEGLADRPLAQNDPSMIYVYYLAWGEALIRSQINYATRQNLPRYSRNAYQDVIAELFYNIERKLSRPAVTSIQFYLSEPGVFDAAIPAGTRVTPDGQLNFATDAELVIPAGETAGAVGATCESDGLQGNGFEVGAIKHIIDFPAVATFSHCENVVKSHGGVDHEGDAEFYKRMRLSRIAFSTAGPIEAYEYFALSADPSIVDAKAVMPEPGYVDVYITTHGGSPTPAIVDKVYAAINADRIRPLTDSVSVRVPALVNYSIDFTYYILEGTNPGEMAAKVAQAVSDYIVWQSAEMGRDINPSKLNELLMKTGIKRPDIRSPVFTPLSKGDISGGVTSPVELAKLVSSGFDCGGAEGA